VICRRPFIQKREFLQPKEKSKKMSIRTIRQREEPVPDAPPDLSAESQDLWVRLVPTEARSLGRRTLLLQALRALDRANQARRELADQGLLVVTPRTGFPHANPLLKIEREARSEFAKIWSKLGLTFNAQIDGRGG
jgi:P27 family predicted phage terminase small subunit